MTRLKELAADWFTIDVRGLALFRICAALLILWDLAQRLPDVRTFMTDEGFTTRMVIDIWFGGQWSLHDLSGAAPLQYALMAVAALFAVSMGLGFWTRTSTLLSWVLLASLHHRNPAILNSGDDLLRMTLLLCTMLPMGAAWSLDARGRPPAKKGVLHPTGGVILLMLCSVYWWVVIHRFGMRPWFEGGNAVFLALSIDIYTTELGAWVRDNLRPLLKPLTWMTMLIEGLGPFLVFSPWRHGAVRTFAVALFVGMHCTFGLMMHIGIFWGVSSACWLMFLPTWFWDRLEAALPAFPGPPLVDGRDTEALVIFSSFAVICFLMMTGMNLEYAAVQRAGSRGFLPVRWVEAGAAIGMNKEWRMYSPPPRMDGWLVVVATRPDGTEVDLRTGDSPPTWEPPARMTDLYVNQRWRRVLFSMHNGAAASLWRPFSNWSALEWERTHPGEQFEEVALYWMDTRTVRGKQQDPERKELARFDVRR